MLYLRFIGHGCFLRIYQDFPECAQLLTMQLRWCWRQIRLQPFCNQHSTTVKEGMMFWARGGALQKIFIFSCPQLTALSHNAKAPWGRALWSTLRRPMYGQRMTKNHSAKELCCLLSVYWGSLFLRSISGKAWLSIGTQDGYTEKEQSDHFPAARIWHEGCFDEEAGSVVHEHTKPLRSSCKKAVPSQMRLHQCFSRDICPSLINTTRSLAQLDRCRSWCFPVLAHRSGISDRHLTGENFWSPLVSPSFPMTWVSSLNQWLGDHQDFNEDKIASHDCAVSTGRKNPQDLLQMWIFWRRLSLVES